MHLYVLDLVRFLCAFYVVLFHFLYRSVAMNEYNAGLYESVMWAAYGWVGVQVFFVISGFIVFKSASGKSPIHFVRGRFLRLYPAYWICMSITLLAMFLSAPSWWDLTYMDVLVNFTMAQGFVGVSHVDGVYWTLVHELAFYFWVFVFLCLGRLELIKWFLLCMSGLYVLKCFGALTIPGVVESAFLMKYGGYFLIGLVISQMSKETWRNSCLMLIVPAVAAWLEVSFKVASISERSGIQLTPVVPFAIVIVVVALVYLSKVVPVRNEKFAALFVRLGAISYPIYLLHQNLGYVLIDLVYEYLGFWGSQVVTVLIVLLITNFVVSAMEKPFRMCLSRLWDRAAVRSSLRSLGCNRNSVSQ